MKKKTKLLNKEKTIRHNYFCIISGDLSRTSEDTACAAGASLPPLPPPLLKTRHSRLPIQFFPLLAQCAAHQIMTEWRDYLLSLLLLLLPPPLLAMVVSHCWCSVYCYRRPRCSFWRRKADEQIKSFK